MLAAIALLAIKIGIIVAFAAIAARALHRASAASRHFAWSLGLAGILALPVVSLVMPAWGVPTFSLLAPAPTAQHARSQEPRARVIAASTELSRLAAAAPASAAPAELPPRPWMSWLAPRLGGLAVLAWILGSVAALARLLRDLVLARALVGRGAPSEAQSQLDVLAAEIGCGPRPRLVESPEVSVPMTFGARRPALVVPRGFASWDLPRRREVLLHELAHVTRRDWSVSLLARVTAALFWFHPLVHVAERRLRFEAEQAADDLVLAHGTRASSYAAHLLGFVRVAHPASRSSAMTLSMIGGPLDQRIHALLDGTRARGPLSLARRASLGAAALAVVVACSSVELRAEPPAPPARTAPAKSSAWECVTDAVHSMLGGLPTSGSGWYSRGMRLHEKGEHAEAIECWKKAMGEGHRAGACAYNIACAHARMQQSPEALASLERAIAAGFDVSNYLHRDDDLASLHGNAAFEALRDKHGDPTSAEHARRELAELERASRIDGRAAYNLACARALAGRHDEALRELERSVELGFSDADHAAGDSDLASLREAEAFLRLLDEMRAVQMPTSYQFLGRELSVDRDDWIAARDRHREYLKRHPESGHAWSNLGYIQLQLDAPDAALAAYSRAQELNYSPGQTEYNVACCHARAGRSDAAFEALALASARGFQMGSYLRSDDDLASLRKDPRFAELEQKHPSASRRIHDHLRHHFRSLTAL